MDGDGELVAAGVVDASGFAHCWGVVGLCVCVSVCEKEILCLFVWPLIVLDQEQGREDGWLVV